MAKEAFGSSFQMNFIDYFFTARGILRYNVYRHLTGEKILIEKFEDHNLILTGARIQMAHLTAGDVEGRHVTQIAFGTNGTNPDVSDTIITNPYKKAVSGFEYPDAGNVKFNWGLGVGEANGLAILEFGLLTADGTLYSRRVRESGLPIYKQPDISLEGSWEIDF
jgi:hypothetical protein